MLLALKVKYTYCTESTIITRVIVKYMEGWKERERYIE